MTRKPDSLPLTWSEPKAIKCFPIDHVDWLHIKRRISKMKEPFKYYESIAGIFGGAALVCLFELYKAFVQNSLNFKWWQAPELTIGLGFFAICAVFYCLAQQQNDHACERIEMVLSFCETVEDKTNDEFLLVEAPMSWTQKVAKQLFPKTGQVNPSMYRIKVVPQPPKT